MHLIGRTKKHVIVFLKTLQGISLKYKTGVCENLKLSRFPFPKLFEGNTMRHADKTSEMLDKEPNLKISTVKYKKSGICNEKFAFF